MSANTEHRSETNICTRAVKQVVPASVSFSAHSLSGGIKIVVPSRMCFISRHLRNIFYSSSHPLLTSLRMPEASGNLINNHEGTTLTPSVWTGTWALRFCTGRCYSRSFSSLCRKLVQSLMPQLWGQNHILRVCSIVFSLVSLEKYEAIYQLRELNFSSRFPHGPLGTQAKCKPIMW